MHRRIQALTLICAILGTNTLPVFADENTKTNLEQKQINSINSNVLEKDKYENSDTTTEKKEATNDLNKNTLETTEVKEDDNKNKYEVDTIIENHDNEENKRNTTDNENIGEEKESKVDDSEIINIPDTNLKKAINKNLGQNPYSNITKNQLESIKNLNCRKNMIKNLEGLQYCTNLKKLVLSENEISDINALSMLINLQALYIQRNKISDINALSGLINLQTLDIDYNKISDISALRGLINLQALDIDYNKISDINTLSGLTNLQRLDLTNNKISDVISLSNLSKLDTLLLSFNRISDISALSKLYNLKTIDISSQTINRELVNSKGNIVEIENNIKNIDGKAIPPNDISNSGIYNMDTNLIKWDNITSDTTKNYKFSENVQIGNAKGIFSGIVNQPIKYSNDKPVISGADNVSIKEGTEFDPMKGVTATDTEDGNITKDIKVSGKVDIDKPGRYELTYTVTDKDGSTTTVKRVVTVKPKVVGINAIPVIKAENKTIKVGDKFNPMTGVTATDKEDGNITKDIRVIENTVDTSKVGTYKVVYEVTDKQGAKTMKTITVIVRSNDKPVISGADNVSIKEGTEFNPMKGVTATDTEDGNITKDIKVSGKVDIDKPGKYELTYTVTDKDGNTTTVKRVVTVKPKMVVINATPVIKAENKTIKVGDKFNPMTGVTATDKEDGNITKDIRVIENTVDTSKVGTYKVVYEVTDKQGAKTTKTITVTVINDNTGNSTNNSTSTESKPSGNTNDIVGNNEITINKPNNSQQNNQVTSNPKTGDTGILGFVGLGVASLVGLVSNRKRRK